jgi:hypothetical protein
MGRSALDPNAQIERVERLPAMLVISYRLQELTEEHPLHHIIGALAGPAVLRMELEGLSDPAVAQLAAAVGLEPGPVVAAVGGNPFYLTEILAAPGATIPPSVRHAVMARFSSLPPSCRSALEQLAVIPPRRRRGWRLRCWTIPRCWSPPSGAGRGRCRAIPPGPPRRRRPRRRRRRPVRRGGGERGGPSRGSSRGGGLRPARPGAGPLLDQLEVARLHGVAALALYAVNRFGEAAEHADRAVQLWDASGSTALELGQALLISARISTLLADPTAARAKALRAHDVLEPLGPSHALALCYSTLGAQDALQTTRLREQARRLIHGAVGATGQDLVIFCGSGMTASVNKLVGILELRLPAGLADRYRLLDQIPPRERPVVFVGPFEHHSNELPWREPIADVVAIGEDGDGHIDLAELEAQLLRFANRRCGSAASLPPPM